MVPLATVVLLLALGAVVAMAVVPLPWTPVEFLNIFEEFRAPSWDGWRTVLDRLTPNVREFYAIVGRGAGKSRIIAALACAFATRKYRRVPGEHIYVGIFAPDRKQAEVTFRYIVGLLKSVPALAALIVNETRDSIELSTGVIIEVGTARAASPRNRSYALVIVEEAAYLPTDETAAEPDVELLRAVRPALARVPGSLLAVISSPYARRGVLYDAWRKYHGRPDGDVVLVQAPTLDLNPTFDRRAIEKAYEDDPASAAAEYGAEFRSDVATLLNEVALTPVVPIGQRELPPDLERTARGHLDAATGSGEDAVGVGVAWDGEPAELAAVRQWRPPFDPAVVVREAAELFRRYGVYEITIDRYAPGLVASLFARHGIACRPTERDTSAMFIELLALINCGGVRLLDDPVLLGELRRLERKPGQGGREQVGHPPRGHDDVAAACAAALVAAAGRSGGERRATLDPPDTDDPDVLAAWCPLCR